MRINAQISAISSQLHMCQTPCRGEITEAQRLSFFFFFPGLQKAVGCVVKNRSLHSGWWQEPHRPAFGLQVAGIHRDEPDGRHLGQ